MLDQRGVQARHLLVAGSVASTLLAVLHTVVDGVFLALERLVVAVVALPVRHASLLVVQVQRTLHRKAGEGHAAHEHLRLGIHLGTSAVDVGVHVGIDLHVQL